MTNHSGTQQACVLFNRLTVTSVEHTSGIFIGTNQAIGWSSVSKSNQGFGSASDCRITDSIHLVQDPDVMDNCSSQAVSIPAASEGPPSRHWCDVSFRTINALSLSNGSAIGIGENRQNGWSGSHKTISGTGKLYGGNRVGRVANLVQDGDAADTVIRVDKRFSGGCAG